MCLWRIWFCRNQLALNLGKADLNEVIRWTSDYMDDWNSACLVERPCLGISHQRFLWRPLEEGVWKINTDATTCYSNHFVGLGIVIRDKFGLVKGSASLFLKAMVSPLIAEALDVERGIAFAVEQDLVPFHIETDSRQVAVMVNKGLVLPAEIGPTISLILSSLNDNPGCVVSHVYRKGNLVAHGLAKLALSSAKDSFWLDAYPPCVERLVRLDASG